ncbi:unnamed protein product [Urochloa humidicola]
MLEFSDTLLFLTFYFGFSLEGDNHDNVPTILGEDFAKNLNEKFSGIPSDLHNVSYLNSQLLDCISRRKLKNLKGLVAHLSSVDSRHLLDNYSHMCLSVFFQHNLALSDKHNTSA